MQLSEHDIALQRLFAENRELIEKDAAPEVNAAREGAMEAFSKLGIPSSKVEAYKYTNLQAWFKAGYTQAYGLNGATSEALKQFECNVHELDSYTLFTVNGKFVAGKIGRASCRERVEVEEVRVYFRRRKRINER